MPFRNTSGSSKESDSLERLISLTPVARKVLTMMTNRLKTVSDVVRPRRKSEICDTEINAWIKGAHQLQFLCCGHQGGECNEGVVEVSRRSTVAKSICVST